MKQKSLLITLLLAAFLLPALSPKLMSTTPDTAWTVTLPENLFITGAMFSNDDSLLITIINDTAVQWPDKDSNYIVIFNAYTGQPIDTLKEELNASYIKYYKALVAPDTSLLFLFFDHHFDSTYNMVPDFRFLVYNYKTGNIVDSIFAPANEPSLRPDTSRVHWFRFTPDGAKMYMDVRVIEDYDEYTGDPIYGDQLFVWDTSDWTIHRKEVYWHSDGLLRIMPNNRMYKVFWEDTYPQEVDCYFFRDMEVDTNIYELCEDETSYYSGLIFPKTDTTKFINFVYDKDNGYKSKIQVRSQSDISLIKTIDNDSIYTSSVQFLKDSKYIIYYITTDELKGRLCVYDIDNEYSVYIYPLYDYIGEYYGSGTTNVSNNGELIFDGYSRTLRMLNAKYTTTSAEEQGDEPSSMLYPNPAGDYVEVTLSNHTLKGVVESVKVFNVLGVCVITSPPAPLHSGEGSKVRLNVSHLPPGVYFVQIGSRVQRFVKM